MKYKQDAPFAVQIELAEGCNLRCPFCGLNGIRGKENNFKFMTPETLKSLITQIVKADWNPRLEFAMHGEPTMHPDYHKMIYIARTTAPKLQIMLTSNGGGLLKKPGASQNIVDLFESGLNVLALDDYDGIKIVDKIINSLSVDTAFVAYTEVYGDIQIYDYPKEAKGNPHMRRKLREKVITVIKDISIAQKGTHSTLNNHAGAAAPKNDKQAGKRCAKPFRELSVRWDGSVAICCNDWRGVYKCGNVVKDGLLNVWHGAAMTAARNKLYHGQRDFGACDGCDAKSYRAGLLPDKLGKVKLPKPSPKDLEAIAVAAKGKSYTVPVLRPWEKK